MCVLQPSLQHAAALGVTWQHFPPLSHILLTFCSEASLLLHPGYPQLRKPGSEREYPRGTSLDQQETGTSNSVYPWSSPFRWIIQIVCSVALRGYPSKADPLVPATTIAIYHCFSSFIYRHFRIRNSLTVQWLGLHASIARARGSNLWLGSWDPACNCKHWPKKPTSRYWSNVNFLIIRIGVEPEILHF